MEVDHAIMTGDMGEQGFQLTTSRGGRPMYFLIALSIFPFQLTTSRGGRLYETGELKESEIFQLTTSRGGRL